MGSNSQSWSGWMDYRYSPFSPLHLFGRDQDIALERTRHSINGRLHLRRERGALNRIAWVREVVTTPGVPGLPPGAFCWGILLGVTISPTASRRELDRAAGAKGFVGGQHDPQAVDRIAHVVGEVAVV